MDRTGVINIETEGIWEAFLNHARKIAREQAVDTWLKPLKPLGLQGSTLKLLVPNQFFREHLEERYRPILTDGLREITGREICLDLIVDDAEAATLPPPEARGLRLGVSPKFPAFLNQRYTFSRFVVGNSNQFAHAAAQAVAESPAAAYNPLFLYGGVGLGKTHLMHAIGHHIFSQNPRLRLFYTSSEDFTIDLINSIRRDRMTAFREKYRRMDVLLVDDIQFITGKDRTQEEFFHTFNALYESKKQIVISSDKFPKEMIALEERLRSRFEWGLVADIQPPDLETKVAIMTKKAEESGVNLPQDVALLVAKRIRTNIRELEGCLIRLSAFSSLTKRPISVDMAEEILQQMFYDEQHSISIDGIQKTVAAHFTIKLSDLKSKRRHRSIAEPRQIAMFLARELTGASLSEIGRHFGGKDHSTVIHSCNKIAKIKDQDRRIASAINQIRRALNV
ncbi:MAG: chromosomal replication initiator protein DnaA [Nitrospinota bacterium]